MTFRPQTAIGGNTREQFGVRSVEAITRLPFEYRTLDCRDWVVTAQRAERPGCPGWRALLAPCHRSVAAWGACVGRVRPLAWATSGSSRPVKGAAAAICPNGHGR